MAIISFLWQLYCFNLDNGHLKAKNHVADKNLLFSVKIEKIKGGLGFPLCKFCKKKSARLQLRKWRWGVNWQCGTEDVGGDQLGGRPLEHKDDADTGVARGGNRYQFKHFVKGIKSIELDPTDSCMLRSTRWLLSEKKARCPWQVDLSKGKLYATRRGDVLIFNKHSCSVKNGIGDFSRDPSSDSWIERMEWKRMDWNW